MQIAGYTPVSRVLTGRGEPEQLTGTASIGGLLQVTGVQPLFGRLLTVDDETADVPGRRPQLRGLATTVRRRSTRDRSDARSERCSADDRWRDAARIHVSGRTERLLDAVALRRGVPRQPRSVFHRDDRTARARRDGRPGAHGDGHGSRLVSRASGRSTIRERESTSRRCAIRSWAASVASCGC